MPIDPDVQAALDDLQDQINTNRQAIIKNRNRNSQQDDKLDAIEKKDAKQDTQLLSLRERCKKIEDYIRRKIMTRDEREVKMPRREKTKVVTDGAPGNTA